MSSNHPLASKLANQTGSKETAGSPGQFVKPADLFKMRRRSSNVNNFSTNSAPSPLAFGSRLGSSSASNSQCNNNSNNSNSNNISTNNNSNNNNNNNNNSSNSNSTCTTPVKNLTPNSRMRFSSPAKSFFMEPQSPLKCLNNLSEPSPQKKLPVLLKNPFNQPSAVKRRLNLGCSPRKDGGKSPNKKTRMLGMDEDANLEPPKMKQTTLSVNGHNSTNNNDRPCYTNDWTLRSKIKVTFKRQCKNWNNNSISTHKRRTGLPADYTPTKLSDKSISIDAIKNVSTFYQHPYLPWKSLYPRKVTDFDKKKEISFSLSAHPQVVNMMHKDWSESLDDLTNLLIDGRCPFFYVCSDISTILFKQIPSSNPRKPLVQAYISPISYGMGCGLKNIGVEFNYPELTKSDSSGALSAMDQGEISQASFCSSQTKSSILNYEGSSQSTRQNSSKVASSVDSGNVSDPDREVEEDEEGDDICGDENENEVEDGDGDSVLVQLGLSRQECPFRSTRKGYTETDSKVPSKTKTTSYKPLAIVEGTENIRKLVKFLQTNQIYTISKVGKFAFIPPTLLSPREFRLSTPQHPEVVLSKNMIESSASAATTTKRIKLDQQQNLSKSPFKNNNNEPIGPAHIELQGTILPHMYIELHKLLTTSDNSQHTCQSTPLNESLPFKDIQFTL